MSWVGRAKAELDAGRLHFAALLFPEGTEFVHSVRYLDVLADGSVGGSAVEGAALRPQDRMAQLHHADAGSAANAGEALLIGLRSKAAVGGLDEALQLPALAVADAALEVAEEALGRVGIAGRLPDLQLRPPSADRRKVAEVPPALPSQEVVLLGEIRDLLRKQTGG